MFLFLDRNNGWVRPQTRGSCGEVWEGSRAARKMVFGVAKCKGGLGLRHTKCPGDHCGVDVAEGLGGREGKPGKETLCWK